jgi:hypothetical protein
VLPAPEHDIAGFPSRHICDIFTQQTKTEGAVKKFIVLAAGASAAAAMVVIGSGMADANPGVNTLDVTGQPYARAVAILQSQGYSTSFGGSIGSDVPQSKCIVSSQKTLTSQTSQTSQKIQLMLNCTDAAQPEQPAVTAVSGAQAPDGGTRPTAGAPGVVTVIPTPVGIG